MNINFTMSQIHCIGSLAQDELKSISKENREKMPDWIDEMEAIIKETDRLNDEDRRLGEAFNFMIKRSLERSKVEG